MRVRRVCEGDDFGAPLAEAEKQGAEQREQEEPVAEGDVDGCRAACRAQHESRGQREHVENDHVLGPEGVGRHQPEIGGRHRAERVVDPERGGQRYGGEYRRRSWYQDFVLGLENTAVRFEIGPLSFADDRGNRAPTPRICVEGRLRRGGPIMVDAYAFLRKATKRTPKVTMPAPSELHFFGGLGFGEIGELKGCSLSTVERQWRSARALLRNYMS